MASKWKKIAEKYPKTVASDMTSAADKRFLEKVDEVRESYSGMSLPVLMESWTMLSKEWDELKDREKEMNVEFEAMSQLIQRKFLELGVDSMRAEKTGENFYLQIEPEVGVTDLAAFEGWVESDPSNDYLWSINAQTRKSLVKSYLEAGDDEHIPPGLKVEFRTSVRSRKS